MATGIYNMQLYYELKSKFPDTPESMIVDCVNKHPFNKDQCMAALRQTIYHYHQQNYQPMNYPPSYYQPQQQQPIASQTYYQRTNTNESQRSISFGGSSVNYVNPPGLTPQSAPVVPMRVSPFQFNPIGVPARSPVPRRAAPAPPAGLNATINRPVMNLSITPLLQHESSNQALVKEQRFRKEQLHSQIVRDRTMLNRLRAEVVELEYTQQSRKFGSNGELYTGAVGVDSVEQMQSLKGTNRRLLVECQCMQLELDREQEKDSFYDNFPSGQKGVLQRQVTSGPNETVPYVNVLPEYDRQVSSGRSRDNSGSSSTSSLNPSFSEAGGGGDGQRKWACTECTYHNEYRSEICEICDMRKFVNS